MSKHLQRWGSANKLDSIVSISASYLQRRAAILASPISLSRVKGEKRAQNERQVDPIWTIQFLADPEVVFARRRPRIIIIEASPCLFKRILGLAGADAARAERV